MIHKHLDKLRINGECWEWLGCRSDIGYGYFQVAGRDYRAAYYVWFLVWHRWPEILLHSCDHPWCVNPEHLSEDTQSENEHHDTRKDRCSHGHAFDDLNTYRYMDRRMCKACARIRQLKKRIERAQPVQPAHLGAEDLPMSSAGLLKQSRSPAIRNGGTSAPTDKSRTFPASNSRVVANSEVTSFRMIR